MCLYRVSDKSSRQGGSPDERERPAALFELLLCQCCRCCLINEVEAEEDEADEEGRKPRKEKGREVEASRDE